MPKAPALTPADTLGFLIKSHYLGNDIPDVVTTVDFSAWCKAKHAGLPDPKLKLGRTTAAATFTAPWKDTRRVMSIPHPASQLNLSIIINDNLAAISAEISGAHLSLYDTTPDRKADRVFKGLDFEAVSGQEVRTLAHSAVVMTADIGNFFHTIYSHSVPWAALGKQWVKDTRLGNAKDPDLAKAKAAKAAKATLAAHWSDRIDEALMGGNMRETFGIPVGPDTSRMIGELLLAGVQKDMTLRGLLAGKDGYRLMDDFFVGFDTESEARKCLYALRSSLWAFNLYLNDRKTKIVPALAVDRRGWKFEIEDFPLHARHQLTQRRQLQRLVDITIDHCVALGDGQPAASFCKRVIDMKIIATNMGFVLDCLLRIARQFPANTRAVATFVIDYRNALRAPALRATLDRWTAEMLGLHGGQEHDLEVCWCLIIRGVLRLQSNEAITGNTDSHSAVTLRIAGLLSEQFLLTDDWDTWNGPSAIAGGLANGRYWLPNYEAVKRGWTTDAGILKEIQADPLFGQLLKDDVSFLDDSLFTTDDEMTLDPDIAGAQLLKIAKREPVRSGRRWQSGAYV